MEKLSLALILLISGPLGAWALDEEGGGWLDAGASLFRPRGGALAVPGTSLLSSAWLDAGAGRIGLAAGEVMVAVWKSEKLASAPAAAFDTWKLHFRGSEGGSLSRVSEWELGAGGAREASVYGLVRGEGLVLVTRKEGPGGEARPFATLLFRDGAWEAQGPVESAVYRPLAGGGLAIERRRYGGLSREEYLPGGKARASLAGKPEWEGSFTRPEDSLQAIAPAWVERQAADPQGILDLSYTFDSAEDDALSLSVGDVEPQAQLAVAGLSRLTAGSRGLENLVVAEVVLGPDRRLTPVLVWSWLGELPARIR